MDIFGFGVSQEEELLAKRIKDMSRVYPSARVVGRGTVVIDPSDISVSANYQDSLKKAAAYMAKKQDKEAA